MALSKDDKNTIHQKQHCQPVKITSQLKAVQPRACNLSLCNFKESQNQAATLSLHHLRSRSGRGGSLGFNSLSSARYSSFLYKLAACVLKIHRRASCSQDSTAIERAEGTGAYNSSRLLARGRALCHVLVIFDMPKA
jgi:hypothetical protein